MRGPSEEVSQRNQAEKSSRSSASSGRTRADASGSSAAEGSIGRSSGKPASTALTISLDSVMMRPSSLATGMPPEGWMAQNHAGLSP